MRIVAHSDNALKRFRQGSQQAEFLLCDTCGHVIAVVFDDGSVTYGAANASILSEGFGATVTSSPKKLGPEDKVARWKQLWFRGVRIEVDQLKRSDYS